MLASLLPRGSWLARAGAASGAAALGAGASASALAPRGRAGAPARGLHIKKYEGQREVKNFTMVSRARLCGRGAWRRDAALRRASPLP